jgi:hypothetical protein
MSLNENMTTKAHDLNQLALLTALSEKRKMQNRMSQRRYRMSDSTKTYPLDKTLNEI